MRRAVAFCLLGVCLACGGGSSPTSPSPGTTNPPTTPPPPSTGSGYTFASEGLLPGLQGTQPYPFSFGGAVLLYINGSNNTVYRATDGLTFTAQSATLPPNSASYSIVTLGAGQLRMYYLNQSSGAVGSATSTDGLNWTVEAGTRIQLNQFAVPRVVALPSGGFRMYYNEPVGSSGGRLASAISSDGMTFTAEAGDRLTATGATWNDPAVVALPSGGWLLATTNIPNTSPTGRVQEIYLATSTDGLTWTVDTQRMITNSTRIVANPAFLALGDGRFRVYFNHLEAAPPSTNFVATGVISK